MDWKKELKKLELPYREVELKVENDILTYQSSVYKMRIVIHWCLNGTWKSDYSNSTSEIGAKFGRPMYNKMSQKLYKIVKSIEGKMAADKKKKEISQEILGYSAIWQSPAQIIKHISKLGKIEVITENELF